MLPTCKTVQEVLFQPRAASTDLEITGGAAPTPVPEKSLRSRPPGALFFGLAALAEHQNLCWVDGIAADLHFDDFAALATGS
jgi:hypothetical protein